MWCRECQRETIKDKCELCGAATEPDIPLEVYWCSKCGIPIIKSVSAIDKDVCPTCGSATTYLCADLRPVFPEERLLFEILQGQPLTHIESSVWASDNRYYIDGKPIVITTAFYKKLSPETIRKQLDLYNEKNSSASFEVMIKRFVRANSQRLTEIVDEAHRFIQETALSYPSENVVISFSGGKDSTVTADLTVRAIGDPSLVHIFGNTTLEFPTTIEYARRYRSDNPRAIFKTAENKEQDFYQVCEDIGPPARMLR